MRNFLRDWVIGVMLPAMVAYVIIVVGITLYLDSTY